MKIFCLVIISLNMIATTAFAEKYFWEKEVLATGVNDSNDEISLDVYNDKIGISYYYKGSDTRTFNYIEKNGSSTWTAYALDSTGWPGGFDYSSLRFNPISHNPQISYLKYGGNIDNNIIQLKFADYNGVSWNTSILRTGDYPNNSSLEYDPDTNLPIIAFSEGSNPSTIALLKYNGNSWGKETIQNSRGRGVDLEYSNNEKAVVAFMDDGQQKLKVARQQEDGSWVIDTIDDIGTMVNLGGSHVSLAFDNNGVLHVAYASSVPSGGKLKCATFDGANWNTQLLVDSNGISRGNLLFDASNNPLIAYQDNAIYLAYLENGTWRYENIDPNGYSMSNFVMDNNRSLHIAYLESGSRNLIYAKGSIVPEPISFLLFSIGSLTVAIFGRKKSKPKEHNA